MRTQPNTKAHWGRTAAITAAVAAWQIYDMSTAVETPRQALMLMQYFLLVCALIGSAGSLIMLTRES
jgi:hypothetical protein